MQTGSIIIRKIQAPEAAAIVPLFEGYLAFYGKPVPQGKILPFLTERLQRGESFVFAAFPDGSSKPVGFVQLYPSFTSMSLDRIWILNDLFVEESHRRRGAGAALMRRSVEAAAAEGVVRVDLSTAKDNAKAQGLYRKMDFVRDDDYCTFSLSLT